jgi:HEAT repeat protein
MESSMTPLERTIDVLTKSRNEAAAPALVSAIGTSDAAVFDGVVAALVARRSKAGHLAVLQRWPQLSKTQKQLVQRARSRVGAALRDALLSDDDTLFAAARDVVEASGDFDMTPTLIMVAEQPHGVRSQAAMDLAMRLVNQLVAGIATAREKQNKPEIQDLETMRRCVLESLERSVERYRQHQRDELIEAFVVLAGPHSGTLKAIMEASHHPCFPSVVHTLTVSEQPEVLDLLTTFLTSKDAPTVVRNVLSKRTDQPFVGALLAAPLDLNNGLLRKNLSRIRSFACLEPARIAAGQIADDQQPAAMQWLAACAAPDDVKLDFAEALLAGGSLPGRVAACVALQAIAGQRSNDLVLTALRDEAPDVQAAAVRQLRQRHIPGTMATLIELVDNPHEVVSAAAREALSDFSFDNYLLQFDAMENEPRRAMGVRVARIDREAPTRLKEEMSRPSRRQRIRAIEMASDMGLAPLVADELVERLSDEDHVVRSAAADALQFCTAQHVRDALIAALADRSVAVQMSARSSLQALGVAEADLAATAAGTEAMR